MATAYGQSLGLDSTGLLLALLLTQIVAFPCALIFGSLSKKASSVTLIKICILAYTGIALYAIKLDTQLDFWILAVLVGMFQGAIQALSRSYFAQIIPAENLVNILELWISAEKEPPSLALSWYHLSVS